MQATIEVQAMELASLASLEAEIEAGHESIRQGGARIQRAIAGIKEQALWAEATDKGGKQIYGSFEHYCQVRWGIQKTEAYDRAMAGNIANQMISAGVPETLIPDGTKTLNALADVPVSERRAVLEAAQASGEVISTAIRRIATPEVGHIYAVTEPSSAKDGKTITVDRVVGCIAYDSSGDAYLPGWLEPTEPLPPTPRKPSRTEAMRALLLEALAHNVLPADLQNRIRQTI